MAHQGTQPTKMAECIESCRECADICLETIQHCLGEGGEHAEQKHIALLQVCAEICDTSAHAMLLGSEQHATICAACAEICEACAEDCESFGDDQVMRNCAEACQRCADSCKEMTKMARPRTQPERETRAPL